jgi:hypothetical protein
VDLGRGSRQEALLCAFLETHLVTGSVAACVCDRRIMDQGDYRSLPMVHRYARRAELFKNNPGAFLGL